MKLCSESKKKYNEKYKITPITFDTDKKWEDFKFFQTSSPLLSFNADPTSSLSEPSLTVES